MNKPLWAISSKFKDVHLNLLAKREKIMIDFVYGRLDQETAMKMTESVTCAIKELYEYEQKIKERD